MSYTVYNHVKDISDTRNLDTLKMMLGLRIDFKSQLRFWLFALTIGFPREWHWIQKRGTGSINVWNFFDF